MRRDPNVDPIFRTIEALEFSIMMDPDMTTSSSRMPGIRVASPAKINLHLEILGRRADGYHDLETVMVRVSLIDTLSFQVQDSELRVETICTDSRDAAFVRDEKTNLVYRALDSLRQSAGLQAGMSVRLVKRIPVQAGLGGASSNAATALRMANQLWALNWSTERLNEIAITLGSDISYFLYRGTAICRGRGEQVEPVSSAYGWPVIIVMPTAGFSTGSVFGRVQPASVPTSARELVASLSGADAGGLEPLLFNRFRDAVLTLSPEQSLVEQALKSVGAMAPQVTGSGSAWFGLFPRIHAAQQAANALRARHPEFRVFVCRTIY
jgi:4-diphosphocytidyl-2-C-methyl-D-erythritol kinase